MRSGMHDVTKRGLALAVATRGLLITGAAPPLSAGSPPPPPPPGPRAKSPPARPPAAAGGGLLTNNTVEVPIHAPLNACGVVLPIIGSGNSATGDSCLNGPAMSGGTSTSAGSAQSGGGLLSGNVVQAPVSIPVNVCGDTVTAVGSGNSAQNIMCANDSSAGSATANAPTPHAPGIGDANCVQGPGNRPGNPCGITPTVAGVRDKAGRKTCDNGGPARAPAAGARRHRRRRESRGRGHRAAHPVAG